MVLKSLVKIRPVPTKCHSWLTNAVSAMDDFIKQQRSDAGRWTLIAYCARAAVKRLLGSGLAAVRKQRGRGNS
ncbi:hypothetical protein NDU88_004031 [Pleurodeles waltl]|uniref:Uncharacterized protein n=1 Tax=Pleurodeles waltl TaxID=8319 RepID=A0AAV7M758_PLEWA|nr:hypothetical protein NDU88_004031 [Pleurodeles waltl]